MVSWREAPVPVSTRFAAGTTVVSLLDTLTVSCETSTLAEAIVKPMPTVDAGSVGSASTPLAAPLPLTARLRRGDVAAASTMMVGEPGAPMHGSNALDTRVVLPGLPIAPPLAAYEPSLSPTTDLVQSAIRFCPRPAADTQPLAFCVRIEPGAKVWSP